MGTEQKINHYHVQNGIFHSYSLFLSEHDVRGKQNLILCRDTKREGKPLVLLKRFNKRLMQDKSYFLKDVIFR